MPETDLLSPHQLIQYPNFGNNALVPVDLFHHWNLHLHKYKKKICQNTKKGLMKHLKNERQFVVSIYISFRQGKS